MLLPLLPKVSETIQQVPPGVRATDTRGYCTHPRVQVPVVPILQAPPTIGRTTAKPCTATQVAHVLQKMVKVGTIV